MSMDVPRVELNSGYSIPQLGLGVFRIDDDDAARVVGEAFELGYRHIDTAAVYGNEEGVGKAVASSGLERTDLFITTKLWNPDQGRHSPRQALEASLERLGLDYVDLYLIHWPAPARDTYLDSWWCLEELAAEGLARSIGVSNFEIEHLERLAAEATVVPAVNQVELHPAFPQRPLREYQEGRGIHTEAWGPLGQGKYDLASLPGLTEIAAAHGKSLAQVALRWHIQEGAIVFPKTTSRGRLKENISILDFELTPSDMAAIAAMDRDMRVGTHPKDGNW